MRLHKTRSTRDRSIPQLATMSFDEVLMSSGLTFFLFMIQILTCVYQNKKMIFFFFCFPACSQVVQFFKQFVHVSRNTAPPISKHFFVDAIPLLTRWYIYIYIYVCFVPSNPAYWLFEGPRVKKCYYSCREQFVQLPTSKLCTARKTEW